MAVIKIQDVPADFLNATFGSSSPKYRAEFYKLLGHLEEEVEPSEFLSAGREEEYKPVSSH